MPTKTHTYRGHDICPVQYADKAAAGFHWYIRSYHQPTGIMWDSQNCKHYYTLAQAKAAVDELVRDAESIAQEQA